MALLLQRPHTIACSGDGVFVGISEPNVSFWLPTPLRPTTRDVCRAICFALLQSSGVKVSDAPIPPPGLQKSVQSDATTRPSVYELIAVSAARALRHGACAGLSDQEVLDVPGVLEFARAAVEILSPVLAEYASTRKELGRVLAPTVRHLVDRYLEQLERYNRRDMPAGFESWEAYHQHVCDTFDRNRVQTDLIAEVLAILQSPRHPGEATGSQSRIDIAAEKLRQAKGR